MKAPEAAPVASSPGPEAIATAAPEAAAAPAPAPPAVEAVDVLPLLHHLLGFRCSWKWRWGGVAIRGVRGGRVMDRSIDRGEDRRCLCVRCAYICMYLDGAALEEGVVELHGVVHGGRLQELHVREPAAVGKIGHMME